MKQSVIRVFLGLVALVAVAMPAGADEPPGRIITFSGDTSTPVVAIVRRTTASRQASSPVAGV